jgi:hypothetical protein
MVNKMTKVGDMTNKIGDKSHKGQASKQDLLDNIKGIIEKTIEKAQKDLEAGSGPGWRDFQSLVTTYKAWAKDLGDEEEGRWLKSLRELKESYEAVKECALGDPERYNTLFDRGKKKEVLLAV